MRTRRQLAVVVLAIVAAGCADDGSDRAAGGAAPATTPATPAPTTTSTAIARPPRTRPDVRDIYGERPVRAGSPAVVAQQLIDAHEALRTARSSELAAAGHLQQVAVDALVEHPEWDIAVMESLPPELRPAVAADLGAGRELTALNGRPQDRLPAWRIDPPPSLPKLRAWYDEAEAAHGVPWQYLAAVHLTETRFSRIDGLSSAGAQGPMQFLASTWAAYGTGDINDDHDAIQGAANYLAANGAPADMANALYRYNPTPRYVNAVTAYAERIRADETAFAGYHGWEVYYATILGDVLLPVGYVEPVSRPVTPADIGP